MTPTREPSAGEKKLIEAKLELIKLEQRKTMLEIEAMRRDQAEEDAGAFHNRIYTFTEPIHSETVLECTRQLGEWHRLDGRASMKVIINSPGGLVFDGLALYDYIRELVDLGHEITTQGLGKVFSMSAVILQAGSIRSMSTHSHIMLHEVSNDFSGTATDHADNARQIARIQVPMVQILASRSKFTEAQIKKNWSRKDWWLDASEALEAGFIDVIHG